MTEYKRKLIEVALPLDEINAACKADKDRKTGTIRNLHKWFAPMPLPAWRALLFAALVDDPDEECERARLLDLIRDLVAGGADAPPQRVLDRANAILRNQYGDELPPVLDPFCGGGSTLVEAQRLGLQSYGSDLNPVPVLISKVLTELLPRFNGQQPIASVESEGSLFAETRSRTYAGYLGVIHDVERFADEVAQEARDELAGYYGLDEGGSEPLQWLWARTVRCPNPACGQETVLTTSWWLSKRRGDLAWIEPVLAERAIGFAVVTHQPVDQSPAPVKIGDAIFKCVACGAVIDAPHIRSEGQSGHLGARLMAVLERTASGEKQFRSPRASDEDRAASPPSVDTYTLPPLIGKAAVSLPLYGMDTWADVHTRRQLAALTAFADAIKRAQTKVAGVPGGTPEYGELLTAILTLCLGKFLGYMSTLVRVENGHGGSNRTVPAFGRHDLPMTWDFAEINPFASIGASWQQVVTSTLRALLHAPSGAGEVLKADARKARLPRPGLVATDPPYFEAIGYADLSDYYYHWHRQVLRTIVPSIYAALSTPKEQELTALPWRHGNNKKAATDYFVAGFTDTFINLQESLHPELPMIVVYASKEQKATSSEHGRWVSILTSMVQAGLQITGTWPINGTGGKRLVSLNANAVATYVAMIARPRAQEAPVVARGEFVKTLRREMRGAVHDLQEAGILPVDMAQAVMGPGMSVFTGYTAVVAQDGTSVTVGEALALINQIKDEVAEEQEGDLDPESQFGVAWWHKHGWSAGTFGEADALARPKGISVDLVARAGVVVQQPNKVTAVGNADLDRGWDPKTDVRPTAWEGVHHLADRLIDGGGQTEAARLLGKMDEVGLADSARMLTYRLAAIASSTQRTRDEERYNALIEAWPRLVSSAPTEGLF